MGAPIFFDLTDGGGGASGGAAVRVEKGAASSSSAAAAVDLGSSKGEAIDLEDDAIAGAAVRVEKGAASSSSSAAAVDLGSSKGEAIDLEDDAIARLMSNAFNSAFEDVVCVGEKEAGTAGKTKSDVVWRHRRDINKFLERAKGQIEVESVVSNAASMPRPSAARTTAPPTRPSGCASTAPPRPTSTRS